MRRTYRNLRAWMKWGPRGTLLRQVFEQPIWKLIVTYFLVYVLAAVVFFDLYRCFGTIWDAHASTPTRRYWDCLYFSFTTQSTLGYGDLSPRGPARLLSVAQTTIGFVLNALALGLIVARIIKRKPAILFVGNIAHNKDTHAFVFWFWNREADDLCNFRAEILVRRPLLLQRHTSLRRRNYQIRLGKEAPSYVESMTTIFVRTDGKEAPSSLPDDPGLSAIPLSVLALEDRDELMIVVTAISAVTGTPVAARRLYPLQRIKCGMFDHIEPTDYPSLDWRERDYDRFGNMRKTTTIEECVACSLCQECPLETAVRAREGIAKKAQGQGAALE